MNTAIVLAGGSGRRMNSDIPKQYMMLKGKPVIYYSLKAFQLKKFSMVIMEMLLLMQKLMFPMLWHFRNLF